MKRPTIPFLEIQRDALGIVTGGLSSTIRARPRATPQQNPNASSGVEAKIASLAGALQSLKQPQEPQQQQQAAQPAPGIGGIPLQQLMGQ